MKHIRADFPIFKTTVADHPLIYLDSAATAQKPKQVLDELYKFYAHEYATVGRGLYQSAEAATERYEKARATVAKFIHAQPNDIVFTSGSTHSMNMLAQAWTQANIKAGDIIVLADWEHHSNILPWQHSAALKDASIAYIPVLPDGTLDLHAYEKLLSKKVKAVIISHVSNVFGTTIPVEQMVAKARAVGAKFFLDAAQSAPHGMLDVQKFAVDAALFSAHKMCGPTGVGVLYLNELMQHEMPPYHLGGGMVYETDYERSVWRKAPHKFEAGTPPFAQAIGFQAALEYLVHCDLERIRRNEAQFCKKLIDGLSLFARARIYGPRQQLMEQGHLVSFALDGVPAHDVAALLGSQGICVRAGNLCAQPLAKKLDIGGLIRASFYVYNTPEDVDALLLGIEKVLHTFV